MTTRKASDVLKNYTAMLLDIPRKQVIPDSFVGQELTEAQAALLADLLERLPEKKTLPKQGSFDRKGWQKYDTDSGYNKAIDQTEQAIKAYFGQGE